MKNNELLEKNRQDKIRYYISNIFSDALEKEYKNIESTESFYKATDEVKETEEYKERLEQFIRNLCIELAYKFLGIEKKWKVQDVIDSELRSRLALTKIDNFEKIVSNLITIIDIENYIYKN